MNRRSLVLAALVLGFVSGCSKPPAATSSPPASENGTPSSENGTPTMTPPPSNDSQPKQGESAVYIVKDSGVRCFAPPCPTYNAFPVDKPDAEPIPVHELELSAVTKGSDEQTGALIRKTLDGTGLKIQGTLETRPNAGPAGAATVLRASKVEN
ncbi:MULTISPECIES: DUF6748 domain-containing protein [Myxococcus]|uniref:DUF6748 domain-containing protein n=1 Tax=Myxococcus xanthus TaxID=34 RepID=A0AAE6KQ78_MYXXA|nr:MULTISPECIES: DUF6748 domain-containing protein [Myxococcus]QDE65725.1 hypothetical protein BHS09_01140 [Myxococcus xanthus]QDE72998.1 hypothetical protein BHS08_01140 [Myxococcus xanthus]QDE80280.1 hypothetical protein BHS07_01135 [Myxococcus xanthus]QDE94595.1 hypothetical protein BHS05_01150 [Myxococcus xanthus]QDF01827.1 hypothetical protein BHS04_01150 [Myxococcus xanthus]